jgi:iron complex outermembrane receptor protein
MNLGAAGKLSALLNWTHVNSFKRVLNTGDVFEYAGTQGPYSLSSAAGTPKDRGNFSLTWDRGEWSFTGTLNYVSSMKAIDHVGETMVDLGDGTWQTTTGEGAYITDGTQVCGVFYPNGQPAPAGCKIKSFYTFDLYGRWAPSKAWEINFSIQNLFNKRAPFDPYTYGGVNYNPAFHQAGAVGTFITVGAKYSWR